MVAGEIVRLLNGNTKIGGRRLKPEDIAVLVLENRQAAKVQEALSEFNVPSVLHTTASLFESQEAPSSAACWRASRCRATSAW